MVHDARLARMLTAEAVSIDGKWLRGVGEW